MRAHASIVVVTGLLLLGVLVSGLWMSRDLRLSDPRPSGKPLASGISAVHKLMAFALLFCAVVTIRHLHRGLQFTSLELTGVIAGGLSFLALIISGSFLSLGKPRSDELLTLHKVGSLLTVISISGAVYLLTHHRP